MQILFNYIKSMYLIYIHTFTGILYGIITFRAAYLLFIALIYHLTTHCFAVNQLIFR